MLDSDLLRLAKATQAQIIDAEHAAEAARAEFHQAVRRLQLAGGSLREIAEELGLSHQRVHQIVEASGGSRSWSGGRAGSGALLSCSFCGKHQKQVRKLIAGPGVYICDGCIDGVHTVLATTGRTVGTPIATLRQVGADARDARCSFCGKGLDRVEAMATAGNARICNECLDLCNEIISDALS